MIPRNSSLLRQLQTAEYFSAANSHYNSMLALSVRHHNTALWHCVANCLDYPFTLFLAKTHALHPLSALTREMEVDEVKQETESNIPPNPNPNIITERNAQIISGGNVFYNPVQEFNRDLSISVLNVYYQQLVKERVEKELKQQQRLQKQQKASENGHQESLKAPTDATSYIAGTQYDDGLRILEALAATGLRSIRYAQEIAGVRQIIANDLSRQAVESINTNVRHNRVDHLIETSHADAM